MLERLTLAGEASLLTYIGGGGIFVLQYYRGDTVQGDFFPGFGLATGR